MPISEKTTLTACIAFCLAVGATAFMPSTVYSSWWWTALWAVVAAGICLGRVRKQLWRRPWVMVLHFSFLLMLAGGAATAYTSTRGTLHLSPGSPVTKFAGADGDSIALPFSVTLERFEPKYYPGMRFPRDYHSHLTLGDGTHMHISMNSIGRTDGWRFYQTSFDGKGGSVLTVTRDPVGIALTYLGYLLFAVSGVGMWRPRLGRRAAMLLAVATAVTEASAVPAIPDSLARSLEPRQVVFNGRIVPFATMASELTLKLTGKTSVAEMSPTRFVASLITYSDSWRRIPFLKVKSEALRDALGADGQYVSVAALYDDGGKYIPESIFKDGSGALDREILKIDEKVALLAELWSGTLFSIPSGDLRSSASIRSEILYTRLQPVRLFFMLALAAACAGLLALAFRRRVPCRAISLAVFIIGTAIFAWRWTIGGHIPLSNAPEIMFFVAVALSGTSTVCARRSPLAALLGLLMAGFASLVSWLSFKDPAMTPLMPVLASPWLAVHVSLVMVSYAVLTFTFPVALASLLMPSSRPALTALSRRLLGPGVYLLGLGIIVGALWANVSWGRYWAWDPKETWALVTMMLYAIPLHPSLGLRSRPVLFHAFLALAFLSIIMTYAGVNYLPSKHAYQ